MKMKVVLSVLLLAALTGAAHGQIRKMYIIVNLQLNWTEAQAYCRENYVDLASISSREEQNQFDNDTGAQCGRTKCWIGLRRYSSQESFTLWSDGSKLTFTYWSSQQPAGEHGVLVYDKWFTEYSTTKQNFVCYVWNYSLVAVQKMKTWKEALDYCRINYTDLVSLVRMSDHAVVNITSKEIQTSHFWTGLRFLDKSWFWVNRTSALQANFRFMPSCPAPRFRCGARNATHDVLEARDCEEKLNFICYNRTLN